MYRSTGICLGTDPVRRHRRDALFGSITPGRRGQSIDSSNTNSWHADCIARSNPSYRRNKSLNNPPPANRARPVKATWKHTRAAGMQLKRTAILDAAARTMMCSGVDAVSVSGIARELGMSNGVVYYYFANRDELIWECLRRAADELDEALMRAETSAGTTLDRLSIFMSAVLDADNPFAGALTPMLAWGLKDVFAKRARERYLMVRGRVARLLARGLNDGSVATGDPAVASDLLLAVLSRVHAPGSEGSAAAVRSEALRFASHAVRSHARAASSPRDEMSMRSRLNVA